MKVLLDTNVVLDAIATREPFHKAAEQIFLLAANEKVQGLITTNSITDIYYIARKLLTDKGARKALRGLLELFTVVDVRADDCETALDEPMTDYEDALILVCARNAKADYIITRYEEFLKANADIAVITPNEFLQKITE